MRQLRHEEVKNEQRQFPVTVVCDAIRTPENIGMCFRISENFGVQKIYFHESSPSVEDKMVKKTARSTLERTPFAYYSDLEQLLMRLKENGNTIVGIEITDKSTDIRRFPFKKHSKIALVLGSERKGIEKIHLADSAVAIPMYGKNSSMNVIHSLAISLYEITNQLTS